MKNNFRPPKSKILVRIQDCPNCGGRVSMVPYDIGSGPEMSCPTCEWCWGADGQDLQPLDVGVLRPDVGLDKVELRLPLLDQRRTMGPA